MKFSVLTALFAIIAAAPVVAQDQRFIEELVVTGSRLNAATAPSPDAVIDQQALSAQAPVSVLDALQRVPGVYVSQPGGRGGVASVTVRGAESNFTVVLVDGVQVNDPTNTRGGSFDFTTIDINEVQRIEVLRGPSSAVHGSDALAGVINIVTYDPGNTGVQVTLMAGEDGVRSAGVNATVGSMDDGVLNVSASTTQDDNVSADSEFEASNARLNYDKSFNDHRLSARLSYAEAEQRAFPEDSGGREFAVLRQRDSRDSESYSIALGHRYQFDSAMQWITDVTHYDKQEDYTSPGIAGGARNPFGVPANASDSRFSRSRLSTYLAGTQGGVDWVAGVQWQHEDGEADGEIAFIGPTFFELERDTGSLFGEASTRLGDALTMSAGVRSDKADGENVESTWRWSANYAWSDSLDLFARAGTGFKLPSFFALGNPLVGNPSLQPERVQGWEGGFTVQPREELRIEVAGFRNRYEDLIDFDDALFTNVNRSEVVTTGGDLSLQGSGWTDALTYDAFVSYVDIDVKGGGKLRQRPQWQYGANLRLQLPGNWETHLAWQSSSERYDSSIPNPALYLDSYSRIDLAAHWSPTDLVRVSFALDNLADETYSDADGFRASGRRGRIALRLRF